MSYLVKSHMNRVRNHKSAVVTHEEDVLVPHDLAQPLALLDHGGRLVASVPGTPTKKPAISG